MDRYESLYKRGLIDSKEYEKIKVVDLDLALETKLEREFKGFKKDLKKLPKNKIILPKKGVRKVFETPSGYFDIKINERMIIK